MRIGLTGTWVDFLGILQIDQTREHQSTGELDKYYPTIKFKVTAKQFQGTVYTHGSYEQRFGIRVRNLPAEPSSFLTHLLQDQELTVTTSFRKLEMDSTSLSKKRKRQTNPDDGGSVTFSVASSSSDVGPVLGM